MDTVYNARYLVFQIHNFRFAYSEVCDCKVNCPECSLCFVSVSASVSAYSNVIAVPAEVLNIILLPFDSG